MCSNQNIDITETGLKIPTTFWECHNSIVLNSFKAIMWRTRCFLISFHQFQSQYNSRTFYSDQRFQHNEEGFFSYFWTHSVVINILLALKASSNFCGTFNYQCGFASTHLNSFADFNLKISDVIVQHARDSTKV